MVLRDSARFGTAQHWCPGLVLLPLSVAGAQLGTNTALLVLSAHALEHTDVPRQVCAWL